MTSGNVRLPYTEDLDVFLRSAGLSRNGLSISHRLFRCPKMLERVVDGPVEEGPSWMLWSLTGYGPSVRMFLGQYDVGSYRGYYWEDSGLVTWQGPITYDGRHHWCPLTHLWIPRDFDAWTTKVAHLKGILRW